MTSASSRSTASNPRTSPVGALTIASSLDAKPETKNPTVAPDRRDRQARDEQEHLHPGTSGHTGKAKTKQATYGSAKTSWTGLAGSVASHGILANP